MNPRVLSVTIDAEAKTLSVSVSCDRVDGLTGLTERGTRQVTGPLAMLTGVAALRQSVLEWVKAQSGFAGTIEMNA